MSKLGSKGRVTGGLSLVVALAMTVMALLYTGGSPATSATGHHGAGAGSTSFTRIAHSPQGFAKSKIIGHTGTGKRVTGYFTPLGFAKHNGHLRVHGLVHGVVHKGGGVTRTFDVTRTFRVKSMNGTVPGAARTAAAQQQAACNILNLVLGPLDLNLLGLKVHLDKVVLDIVAQSGAGQLLGNLLCAVAHLLDGNGTLSQLLNQLGQILNQLLMGL
jgi:hypothetical protein